MRRRAERKDTWLRRNRWGLLALPLVVVLAAGANGFRVKNYWWPEDPHHAQASASAGGWVHVVDHYEDAVGATTRTFDVRLASVQPTTTLRSSGQDVDLDLPAGVQALRVSLDFEAAPDQSMTWCQVELLGADGQRYPVDSRIGDDYQDPTCVPEGHEGPSQPLLADDERAVPAGHDRPAAWSSSGVVLVPRGLDVRTVRLWWTPPEYVALRLR